MTESVLKKCLEETKKMTEKEVKDRCKKLGLYEYDDKKYQDSNFKIILPVNVENLDKSISATPGDICVTVLPDENSQMCARVAARSAVLNNKVDKNKNMVSRRGCTKVNIINKQSKCKRKATCLNNKNK